MKIQYAALLVGATALLAACDTGSSAPLDTDAQKASYAVGLNIGQSLTMAAGHLDVDAFARGVRDVMEGRDPVVDEAELQEALMRFSQQIEESMMQGQSDVAERNRREGEQYMAMNAGRPGVQTTGSGLQYEVLEDASGARPQEGDMVTIHYRGETHDGQEFDSSYGGEPITFQLEGGPDGLIQGFVEGLKLMPVGSKYRFVIPGDLAYGAMGHPGGSIGPEQTLVFEIELIEIG